MKKFIAILLAALLTITFAGCGKEKIEVNTDIPPIKIGWSDWIGWMPWEIVKEKNLLAENSANAELVYYNNYSDSIAALESGQVSALSVTINDALILKSKINDLQIILVNDVSDGGDGILAKKELNILSIKDLQGKTISLEKNSVSHYLLLRALEENGISPEEVQINDVPADLAGEAFIGSAFLDEQFTQVVATWNPHLAKAKKEGIGIVLFDSSQIYGEITDVLVAKKSITDSRSQDFQATINAWYGAMGMLESGKTRNEAIKIMANKSNVSSEDFESLLLDTEVFTKPKKCIDFMGINNEEGKLSKYTQRVQEFIVNQGLIEQELNLEEFINSTFVIEYYNNN